MTTSPYLEHANISVKSIERAIDFIQTAFPTFKVRGGGETNGRKWIHIGSKGSYLAYNQDGLPKQDTPYVHQGINHLGFVVGDVAGIAKRLSEAGYQRNYPKQVQPTRIRDYFLDDDGNEYEFVQYLTNDIEARNDYND